MKIQNYGEWKGDKRRGHHPPACTCFRCNEERRVEEAAKEEERRVKEYDRRVAEAEARGGSGKQQNKPIRTAPKERAQAPTQPQSSQPSQGQRNRAGQSSQPHQTSSQQRASQAVRQSVAGTRPAVPTRPTPSPRRPRKQESKFFGISRTVTTSALRYAVALHALGIAGLVVYALVQGGAQNVMPTLDGAAEAYVGAWRLMGTKIGVA